MIQSLVIQGRQCTPRNKRFLTLAKNIITFNSDHNSGILHNDHLGSTTASWLVEGADVPGTSCFEPFLGLNMTDDVSTGSGPVLDCTAPSDVPRVVLLTSSLLLRRKTASPPPEDGNRSRNLDGTRRWLPLGGFLSGGVRLPLPEREKDDMGDRLGVPGPLSATGEMRKKRLLSSIPGDCAFGDMCPRF